MVTVEGKTPTFESMSDVEPVQESGPSEPQVSAAPPPGEEEALVQAAYPEQDTGRIVDAMV